MQEPEEVVVPAHYHPHAVPPQPDKTSGIPPIMKSLPKLGKLKQIEQDVLAPQVEDENGTDPLAETSDAGPVNLQVLEKAWKEFTEKAALHPNELLILNRPYQVSEQGEITLEIDNPVQVNEFEKFREDLLLTLRKSTGNSRIRIRLEVKEQQEGNRLYTNQDRLRYLSEKYPTLQEMANKLGLDASF